jgi:ubiquinone/menaquinone biosynthesis C-methylase UbiE
MINKVQIIQMKTIKESINSIWQIPIFYKLLQSTLGAAGHRVIKEFLKKEVPLTAQTILDQGCGTGEYALLFGTKYTGIDNNKRDIEFAKKRYPGTFTLGTAVKMTEIKNGSFDVVFAVGLHHHLPNEQAKQAIEESIRVTRNGGKIIIVDAMWPKNSFNIIGWFLRRIDRGGNVRTVEDTIKLLPKNLTYKQGVLSSFPFDFITITCTKI